MKIEIDFEKKTIALRDNISLDELVCQLKKLKINWREFQLVATETKTEFIPWTIPYIPQPIQPWQPTYEPYRITCGTTIELSGLATLTN